MHSNFNATYMRHLLRITLYCSFFTLWCIFYNCIVQQTTLIRLQSNCMSSLIHWLVYYKSTSWNAKWGKFYLHLCTAILMRFTWGIYNRYLHTAVFYIMVHFYTCIFQQITLDYNLTASLLSFLGLSILSLLLEMPNAAYMRHLLWIPSYHNFLHHGASFTLVLFNKLP